MAYIILSAAFNIVTGIGIDTHMHRIFNILKWVESKVMPFDMMKQIPFGNIT